jgi:hypothetical protein
MSQLLSIENDKIVIKCLAVESVLGDVAYTDSINIAKDLSVAGNINADTITVKRIITEEKTGVNDPFAFISSTEKELDGKGFHFTDGGAARQFVYKEGGRMWSSMDMDLLNQRSYMIDKIPVLSADRLGSSVAYSSLRTVGTLDKLNVTGAVSLSQFAYFNENYNRLGLNIEDPNGTLSVAENNVELVLGSYKNDYGYIGTYSHSHLEIGTDHIARITIANTGSVTIGNPKYPNAVVRIYGKLEVDEIVNDPRDKSIVPFTFKANETQSIYGCGVVWYQNGTNRELIYKAEPDRIFSSEIIDLREDRYLSIGGFPVIDKTGLGSSITNSSLSKLGTLESLNVGGVSTFNSEAIFNSKITASNGINSNETLELSVDGEVEFKITANNNIEIGNKLNQTRTISLYGKVGVGATNTDPDVALTVAGPVSFNNKKFISAESIPTSGRFNKGDICWNTDPKTSDYIGWVCIKEGTPGEWKPFGMIA